jgi:hypothetical protein
MLGIEILILGVEDAGGGVESTENAGLEAVMLEVTS